jgi:hypothetical protein
MVDAYGGNTHELLRDLGDHLTLSLAYDDRTPSRPTSNGR